MGLGEQLLEIFLQWASMLPDMEKIVCVTRCKNYLANPQVTLLDYIKKHNESLEGIDPILRFHTSHGGKIKEIIPNYRPEDYENLGAGILIEYDIYQRPISNSMPSRIKKEEQISANSITTVVNECIQILLPEKYRDFYSQKTPLRDAGFDSLRLLELRTLLNQKLSVQLDPTFFFQYNTPQMMIEFFQQKIQSLSTKEDSVILSELQKHEPIAVIGIGCRFPAELNILKIFGIF